MLDFTLTDGRNVLRLIRPLPSEAEEDFRRRMDTLAAVLAEQASDLIAVVVYDSSKCPICVVSHRLPSDPQV